MSVSHPSSMRNLIVDTVVDTIDTGSSLGQILLQDSGSTTLVTLVMSATGGNAFGAASTGVATANAISTGTVLVAGTASIGLIRTSTQQGTVCSFSVTSTGGGGDVELSSNVLSTGQSVYLTSLTYTGPS